MKFTKLIVLLTVLAIAVTGFNCESSSDPADPVSLVGTWSAHNDVAGTLMEYDATDINPAFKVNVLGLGASVLIIVEENDDYSLVLTLPGSAPETEDGKISINGNKVTMTPDGAPDDAITFTFSIDGDTATLVSDEGEVTFDFGVGDVPAILTLILKRVTS